MKWQQILRQNGDIFSAVKSSRSSWQFFCFDFVPVAFQKKARENLNITWKLSTQNDQLLKIKVTFKPGKLGKNPEKTGKNTRKNAIFHLLWKHSVKKSL